MRSVLNLYPAWFNEPEVLRRQILLGIYEKLGCSETIVGKHSHPAKHSWDHLTSVRPHAFATIQCVLLSLACCAYSAIWHIEACVIGSCVSPRSADPFLGSSDGGVEQTACFASKFTTCIMSCFLTPFFVAEARRHCSSSPLEACIVGEGSDCI